MGSLKTAWNTSLQHPQDWLTLFIFSFQAWVLQEALAYMMDCLPKARSGQQSL